MLEQTITAIWQKIFGNPACMDQHFHQVWKNHHFWRSFLCVVLFKLQKPFNEAKG
jgi:hypothetical protein